MNHKPELLAPAGNIESFFASVQNGADAVYLGLKRFSARATASNFTLEELATLIPYAHQRGVRIYVALNSLIAATEVPELLDILTSLAGLKPDALIVQDPGIFFLVRRHFPGLKLHASTLTGAVNSASVNALERMGAERVVLARELSLAEIKKISSSTQAGLEIFIHGALCYSYSGLCLTSSFRGGRSGLRGECVQPCRLRFRQGKKEGFFLSCNDLCALTAMPALKRLRIAGFKIEGRMKPAAYIAAVVSAYRVILDAATPDEEEKALKKAKDLLSEAPSRHLTSGYLHEAGGPEILTPHRSGSSGIWSATVRAVKGERLLVELRNSLGKGDRLRPESSTGKEEEAFTVSGLFDASGGELSSAAAGVQVYILCSKVVAPGDRLFKIGTKSESSSAIWKKIKNEIPTGARFKSKCAEKQSILSELRRREGEGQTGKEMLILKVGSQNDIVKALQSTAGMVLITATRNNLERIAKQRFSPPQMRKLGFSLPPILTESKDIEYFRAAVKWFMSKGFMLWELNNWGHFDLLGEGKGLRLIAGSRLNLRNGAAFAEAVRLGCRWSVFSLEATREELQQLHQDGLSSGVVVPVYSWPALLTSRLVPDLAEEKPFLTPRKDIYYVVKHSGLASIYADRPVSWLEQLPFLRKLGFRNFLVDISEGPGKRSNALESALSGFAASRSPSQYSLFNLDRRH
ncbi:MAG: U32 family peptidase [Syntrophobacteraceae bacterium]